MFEKVNPSHPDKLADRIAGALVDMAYEAQDNAKIAVEVLLGHGRCFIITESSVALDWWNVKQAVNRICCTDDIELELIQHHQDERLAGNQSDSIRCGDNGIFKGCPVTEEQDALSTVMRCMYDKIPYDGKAVLDGDRVIVCQSHAEAKDVLPFLEAFGEHVINPLGPWLGGPDVDTGATNRKLGSDMGNAVTGGGLHGKDLSKADVSVNIVCHLLAQEYEQECTSLCAIGDDSVTFYHEHLYPTVMPYQEVVDKAKAYIDSIGGFEKLAEWGLV